MNRAFSLFVCVTLLSSPAFARSMMPPKSIGWGEQGATVYRSLLTLIRTETPSRGTIPVQLIVDEKPAHPVYDYPWLQKVRVTVGTDTPQEYEFEPLRSRVSQVTFRIPASIAPNFRSSPITIELLRTKVGLIGPPAGLVVDEQLTRKLSSDEVAVLLPCRDDDPALLKDVDAAKASASSSRPMTIVLEPGKDISITGTLTMQNAWAALTKMHGMVMIRGESPTQTFHQVGTLPLAGRGVDVNGLAAIAANAEVTVKGRFEHLMYPAVVGFPRGPAYALMVESLTIRGKQLPQDLPLNVKRLSALARQAVLERAGHGTTVDTVQHLTRQPLMFTVTVRKAGQTKVFTFDSLDGSITEIRPLN